MLSEKEIRKEIESMKRMRQELIEELHESITEGCEANLDTMVQELHTLETQLSVLEWVLLDDEDVR